jgi:hypothetical protein
MATPSLRPPANAPLSLNPGTPVGPPPNPKINPQIIPPSITQQIPGQNIPEDAPPNPLWGGQYWSTGPYAPGFGDNIETWLPWDQIYSGPGNPYFYGSIFGFDPYPGESVLWGAPPYMFYGPVGGQEQPDNAYWDWYGENDFGDPNNPPPPLNESPEAAANYAQETSPNNAPGDPNASAYDQVSEAAPLGTVEVMGEGWSPEPNDPGVYYDDNNPDDTATAAQLLAEGLDPGQYQLEQTLLGQAGEDPQGQGDGGGGGFDLFDPNSWGDLF